MRGEGEQREGEREERRERGERERESIIDCNTFLDDRESHNTLSHFVRNNYKLAFPFREEIIGFEMKRN